MQQSDIIKVEVSKSSLLQSYQQGYFNSTCFICNGGSVGFYEINNLDEVLLLGFGDTSPAYLFCQNFLSQPSYEYKKLYLQVKLAADTYIDAYLASHTDKYYFIAIESKDIEEIVSFNKQIQDENKLQFFSSEIDVSEQVKGLKIVWWYNSPYTSKTYYLSSLMYPTLTEEETESNFSLLSAEIIDPYNRVTNHEVDDGNIVNGTIDKDFINNNLTLSEISFHDPLNNIANYEVPPVAGKEVLLIGRFSRDVTQNKFSLNSIQYADVLKTHNAGNIDAVSSFAMTYIQVKDSLVSTQTLDSAQNTMSITEIKMLDYEVP